MWHAGGDFGVFRRGKVWHVLPKDCRQWKLRSGIPHDRHVITRGDGLFSSELIYLLNINWVLRETCPGFQGTESPQFRSMYVS